MADFLNTVVEMRSGKVALNCNEKFNELIAAVLETGGKGELNFKLSVKPSKFGMGGVVAELELDHEVKIKKPELEIGRSFFFVGEGGELLREDPDQVAMFEAPEPEKEHANERT